MKNAQPKAIFLKDYQEPNFYVKKIDLVFDLHDSHTLVTNTMVLERNANSAANSVLSLDGQELELQSIVVNGEALTASQYAVDDDSLTVEGLPDTVNMEIVTKIFPAKNTSLEGLYRSRDLYCTQCEAEGFRKITYYLDRPDVMSVFSTKIIADKNTFPTLLSNGNLVEKGEAEEGRHWAKWQDPFKKPAYLFALVAGNLSVIEDSFTTMSGRKVTLQIFVEEKDLDKCEHAMRALKNAMKWDEDVYGREYDLDIFMIVAVDDFNMAAMENKGLNIFNTSCVLAKPETTTDAGFQRVEAVVAHEYFHNWSGNRVTCRDWFQLSLKEGFTVFRDAEFSADMGSRTVKRVEDASLLRTAQFAEDAGPMAHPVQPASFIEISNFYTLTIYEKGAEVVRMIHTLVGPDNFRKGSDLYFERHDGQAVTIEEFVKAMEDASGKDLSQFRLWYSQAGTPVLKVRDSYDADSREFSLTIEQSCPPTPECADKKPFHIPVALGLLGDAGALALNIKDEAPDHETADNTHRVLELKQASQTFVFTNVPEKPVPALLRGFSAPVKLQYRYSRDDLMRLMKLEEDGFSRWDAGQQLAVQVIEEVKAALTNEPAPAVDERLLVASESVLQNPNLDPAMVALMLSLPSETYLAELSTAVDVDLIHHARNRVKRKLSNYLYEQFKQRYLELSDRDSAESHVDISSQAIAKRSLKNVALSYLVYSGKPEAVELCTQQFEHANNMSDQLSALTAIVHSSKSGLAELKARVLNDFYQQWKDDSLVVNSWFGVQASAPIPGTLAIVKMLMQHEAFDIKNPNKLRSVIATFCARNPINFHDSSGSGYAFLSEQIVHLDKQNPQIASRLLTPLIQWKKHNELRQKLMRAELERIKTEGDKNGGLSKDVFEVISKSL